jgi:hypothetical protein
LPHILAWIQNREQARTATVLEIKSNAIESPAADASFDPYGRLLRMLMPSLRGVVVHDGFLQSGVGLRRMGSLRRSRNRQGRHRERAVRPAEFAGIVRTLDADRAVYSFAIRGERTSSCSVSPA